MSLGYRVFFVEGENLRKISQKKFRALSQDRSLSLTQYAGQTVLTVMVYYELVTRKPYRVVRIDTQKIRFDDNGNMDEEYEIEGMRLIAAKLDTMFSGAGTEGNEENHKLGAETENSIIDASERFNERRWSQRNPELSGPLLKKVLKEVFG